MNYLVIDLEMCNVPSSCRKSGFNCRNEIIQIGAVLLDETYNEIGRLSQLVKPEYGTIDKFIENLTGIKESMVKNAPYIKEAVDHLLDWIGDREIMALQWSGSDRSQLYKELKGKNIIDGRIEKFLDKDNWVDYQMTFDKRFGYHCSTSLEQALNLCAINAEGRLHDGLDDAVNTAALIRFLEENRDFSIESHFEEYMSNEPLTFSLGNVFASLNLQAC